MELGKLFNYDFVVSASDNKGIIVQVGCARFCFSSSDDFLSALSKIIKDPEKWEKEYDSSRGPTPEAVVPGEDCQSEGRQPIAPPTTGSG